MIVETLWARGLKHRRAWLIYYRFDTRIRGSRRYNGKPAINSRPRAYKFRSSSLEGGL